MGVFLPSLSCTDMACIPGLQRQNDIVVHERLVSLQATLDVACPSAFIQPAATFLIYTFKTFYLVGSEDRDPFGSKDDESAECCLSHTLGISLRPTA